MNSQIDVARRFHEYTKYRPGSNQEQLAVLGIPPETKPSMGEQDPANEPRLFKVYQALETLELPREFAPMDMTLLDAIAAPGGIAKSEESDAAAVIRGAVPSSASLARISLLSNGVHEGGTHVGKVGYQTNRRSFQYRAAGCTGGLYHLEFYFACSDLPDLDAGLYHYAADTHSLQTIRAGEHRAALVEATGHEPAVAAAPVLLVVTSTFWRNAWRYLERSYRHAYWDLGTSLSHVLAVAAGEGLEAKTIMGFDDRLVNRVLDVVGEREAALCIVALGSGDRPTATSDLPPTGHVVEPVSTTEIDFPIIREMHAASSLPSGAEVARWRSDVAPLDTDDTPTGIEVALTPLSRAAAPDLAIDRVIRSRRSTRRYDAATPMPLNQFSTLLERSLHPIAADWVDPRVGSLVDTYLIVNNVSGLEPGSYRAHPENESLERLDLGEFRPVATRLALGQSYAGEAHVNFYFLADMEPIYERFGNRGYRIAQAESAIRGGKLQLAAHALGIGTVGTTSFDDEVVDFFGPSAAGKAYLFAAVFGMRRRQQREVGSDDKTNL